MKQTLDEFIAAYKAQAGPVCRELWDSVDEKFVERLFNGQNREEDDPDSGSNSEGY
jgi:hypothetical protein